MPKGKMSRGQQYRAIFGAEFYPKGGASDPDFEWCRETITSGTIPVDSMAEVIIPPVTMKKTEFAELMMRTSGCTSKAASRILNRLTNVCRIKFGYFDIGNDPVEGEAGYEYKDIPELFARKPSVQEYNDDLWNRDYFDEIRMHVLEEWVARATHAYEVGGQEELRNVMGTWGISHRSLVYLSATTQAWRSQMHQPSGELGDTI